MSSADLLILIQNYSYFLIFPAAIIEGPIITIISGFLAHLGYLSFSLAYLTLLLSDTTGCTLYYLAGRYWRNLVWVKKRLSRWGYSENSEKFLEDHFRKHKIKTIIIAKFSHGLGWMVHLSAGVAKVNFLEFVFFNIISAIPKTLILMLVGFYLGNSLEKIDSYLSFIWIAGIFVVLFIILYLLINKYVRSFWKDNEHSS